jgi:hypothetical protein
MEIGEVVEELQDETIVCPAQDPKDPRQACCKKIMDRMHSLRMCLSTQGKCSHPATTSHSPEGTALIKDNRLKRKGVAAVVALPESCWSEDGKDQITEAPEVIKDQSYVIHGVATNREIVDAIRLYLIQQRLVIVSAYIKKNRYSFLVLDQQNVVSLTGVDMWKRYLDNKGTHIS